MIETIKIGHRIFQIKVVNKLVDDKKKLVDGLTDFSLRTISIAKEANFLDVLMHEVEHTILNFLGVSETISYKEEERLAEGLANAHVLVFKENPQLLELIKEEKNG